jgi:hypothetical protein
VEGVAGTGLAVRPGNGQRWGWGGGWWWSVRGGRHEETRGGSGQRGQLGIAVRQARERESGWTGPGGRPVGGALGPVGRPARGPFHELNQRAFSLLSRLSRWNAMALRVRDCRERSATELAAEKGHSAIADELNRLEARRQDERLFLRPASPSPRRPSQDSGLDLALC